MVQKPGYSVLAGAQARPGGRQACSSPLPTRHAAARVARYAQAVDRR